MEPPLEPPLETQSFNKCSRSLLSAGCYIEDPLQHVTDNAPAPGALRSFVRSEHQLYSLTPTTRWGLV